MYARDNTQRCKRDSVIRTVLASGRTVTGKLCEEIAGLLDPPPAVGPAQSLVDAPNPCGHLFGDRANESWGSASVDPGRLAQAWMQMTFDPAKVKALEDRIGRMGKATNGAFGWAITDEFRHTKGTSASLPVS